MHEWRRVIINIHVNGDCEKTKTLIDQRDCKQYKKNMFSLIWYYDGECLKHKKNCAYNKN